MNPEGILAIFTAVLAVATIVLAWAAKVSADTAAREFRAARLPVVDLQWRPGASVGTSNSGTGLVHHIGLTCFLRPATSIPLTTLRIIEIRAEPVPERDAPDIPVVDTLLDSGVVETGIPTDKRERIACHRLRFAIQLDGPPVAPTARCERFRVRITVAVSTAAVGGVAERWTSRSTVLHGPEGHRFDVHVDEPFSRESDQGLRERLKNLLQRWEARQERWKREMSRGA